MYIMSVALFLSLLIPIMVYMLSCMLYYRANIDRDKMSAFECGFEADGKARIPFSTRFFLLAIVFIVFDIEVVLIMPFPIMIMLNQSLPIMYMFMAFMIILMVGLFHEWNEGSLSWLN
uniref:NADH-ubiquinone oxidoreductase chain 3 n=1 Tax=Ozobranchus jantseanus TaxID=1955321 RepID=A0A343D0M1_9ANNE|nr:NADH dehydrogenase subunit 3 [Ozobranchus jantseanus]ARR75360.1 NADH dehydrogenase subunit 3 [Ozobranchus jantseanus]